jgi:hypothetical protein
MGLVSDRDGYTGVSQLRWLPESVILYPAEFRMGTGNTDLTGSEILYGMKRA